MPAQAFLQTLCSPAGLKWVLMVFALLVLPAILAPYHSDDYFQLLLLADNPGLQREDGSLWGLFSFIDDDPLHRRQLQDYGVLPWFAAADFHFRFWRPVAELTHWLDFRLFGVAPLPAHLHSALWFLLLAAMVYRLASYTLGEKSLLPWLVLAIFLWDGQHVANIGWVANRNALVAAVLAMLALYGHMRWRDGGRHLYGVLAVCAWGLALASGEIAVGGFSFLLCHALLLDRSGCRRGFVSLLPYLLVLLLWFGFYQAMGFGAHTSGGLYLNPLTEPAAYLLAVLQRIPVYFAASLLPVPAGLSWVGGLAWAWAGEVFLLVSVCLMAGFLAVFRQHFLRDRVQAYWLLASLGSLVPVCATMAQDRLALFQTIGMAMVLAGIIHPLVVGPEGCGKKIRRYIAYTLLFIHLVFSPLHLLAGSAYIHWGSRNILNNALSFPDDTLQGKRLMLLRAPIGEAVSLAGIREVMGKTMPLQLLWLANDESPVMVTKVDNRTLMIEKRSGFGRGFEAAFRSVKVSPFHVGEIIRMSDASIVVESLDAEGYPYRIRVKLDNPEGLDGWRFYTYNKLRYEEIRLPVAGKSREYR